MQQSKNRLPLRRWLPLASVCLGSWSALSQSVPPGAPEANGVQPTGDTLYVNVQDGTNINNGSTESLGVGITRNGNVVVAWEDDGSDLNDLQATWTLLDGLNQFLIAPVDITTTDPAFLGQTVNTRFLSYFRADKSPTPSRTSWGPKIKANPYGDGFGMGATSFELGLEVASIAPLEGAGDHPTVQLIDNAGAPIGIAAGLTPEYSQRDGNVRIGDWDYLSTGNVVIVGESRQSADLVDVYGGTDPATHAILRIVTKDGAEVKAAQLVSATPTKSEIWHGVGSTKNGFGVRFNGDDGRAKLRLFDNAGVPTTTTNIDLGTLVGNPVAATGGRGDGVSFDGNGNDAYAVLGIGPSTEGVPTVLVTVLNANGTVRWSRSVADDLTLLAPGRGDVAIDSLGRVAVAFDDTIATGGFARGVIARVFAANGTPLGGSFYVSEREAPSETLLESRRPRIAFRNDTIAIAWESKNSEAPDINTVAFRQFVLPVKPGSIEAAGLTRIVADTPVINQGLDSLGNWEPYVSVLGTSTFLIEANAFAEGFTDKQRYVVALQPAAGGAAKLGEAIFTDAGQPYRGEINGSRQNGNPGRVGGDPRPGAVNFVAGGEMSPHLFPEFASGDRWNTGYGRTTEGGVISRYATVQPFALNVATLTQTPLAKAFDSANGRQTSGTVFSDQNSRFGGDIVGLGNGNFAIVVEDRSRLLNPEGNCSAVTVIKPDGTIVKETFKVSNGDHWSNLAAFQGGFAVRAQGIIYFYDNDGNLQGTVDQATSGESFDRANRGDNTRIAGHVNQPYVFLAGKVTTGPFVRVAAFDARTRTFVAVTEASEGGFRGDFDRATVAADALGRVVVSWVAKPDGYEQQQVAARVLGLESGAFRALTPTFLPFINQSPVGNIRSYQMSVALTTRQILIAAKGEINLQNQPNLGADSPRELNFYTVISHPNPADDPTPSANATPIAATIIRSAGGVTLTWTGGNGPFKVQARSALNAGNWADVASPAGRTVELPATDAASFFRVVGQ